MIGYLRGIVLDTPGSVDAELLVLTPGGVAYEVGVSEVLAASAKPGGEIELFTHAVYREDGQGLFGFQTHLEKRTFAALLNVSRLGPKTALSILSVYAPEDLARIAAEEDAAALSRVPGIGKKSAERILFELALKLKGAGITAAPARAKATIGASRDAVEALTGLGFPAEQAAPVVDRLLADEPDLDVPTLIRKALKGLTK